jgi:hypothetical protein
MIFVKAFVEVHVLSILAWPANSLLPDEVVRD